MDGTQIRVVIQTVKSVLLGSIKIVSNSQDVRTVRQEHILTLLGNHNVWDVTYIHIRIRPAKRHAKTALVVNTVMEMDTQV